MATKKRNTKKTAKPKSSKRGKKKVATGASRRDIAPLRKKRGQQALKLRRQGKSWAEVGRVMEVSGSYARNCAQDVAPNGELPGLD